MDPRKFNDCYFYYYSTCTKGDNCIFRHEPSALGCETMCAAWQQGKCLDKQCRLRHMELRKNRKTIPCYWETQPSGCRKKHCPFMHKNPDLRTDGIAPSQPGVAQAQPALQAVAGALPAHPAPMPVPTVSAHPAHQPLPAHPAHQPLPAHPAHQPLPTHPAHQPLPAHPAHQPLPAHPEGMEPVQQLPQPVPMLWQHQHQHQLPQRQVVLDSAILGVIPPSELLQRRIPQHHDPQPSYAPIPVDPLVVNFEEESDNESAPSSTPTKNDSLDEEQRELAMLERIQCEAAAFYNYQPYPSENRVKINLSTKYDRFSLDEITGKPKQQSLERQQGTDFKVLSLDEIRARRKSDHTPLTLNLRKRKISTQETVTSEGDKMIKVVRSTSIVYKKVEHVPLACLIQKDNVDEQKLSESEGRKRTISEVDVYDFQDDELVDNCHEFKKIKIAETTSTKPKLIRNRQGTETLSVEAKESGNEIGDKTEDSDNDLEIVSVELPQCSTDVDLSDSEVIVIDSTNKVSETIDLVDLSEDLESDTLDLEVSHVNVPDVVASCHKKSENNTPDKDLLKDIDEILNENAKTSDTLQNSSCDVYDSL